MHRETGNKSFGYTVVVLQSLPRRLQSANLAPPVKTCTTEHCRLWHETIFTSPHHLTGSDRAGQVQMQTRCGSLSADYSDAIASIKSCSKGTTNVKTES